MHTERREHAGLLHRKGGIVLALVASCLVPATRAEFTVGESIPPFSLKANDGPPISVRLADDALTLQVGGETSRPTALLIHLLQPDCLQCRAQLAALRELASRYAERGVRTLGITHRGDAAAAAKLADDLKLPFPIAFGAGAEITSRFAAGDTLGIIDARGVVRYAQVGYGRGDEQLWAQALDDLLAGKAVSKSGVDRERLAVGDRLPVIELPALTSEKPMSLRGEEGRLVFADAQGRETRPKAALGFFSRY